MDQEIPNNAPISAAERTGKEVLIGEVAFGMNKGNELKLDLANIARHTLAVGSTGSGKTVIGKVVAESLLARSIPLVAVDVMGDLLGLAVPAGGPEAYEQLGVPTPTGMKDSYWSIGRTVSEHLRKKVYARYLTPCSDVGDRLAISPLLRVPRGELEADRDEIELRASATAQSLMMRIGMRVPKDGVGGQAELVRGLLTEAFIRAWEQELNLDGVEGIEDFTALVENECKDMPEKEMTKFKSGMRSLTVGQNSSWLRGHRLDWNTLLSAPDGKTPLVIIGLKHLPEEFHPWVVSQVVYSLAAWCASQPPQPGRPRVGLFLDELSNGNPRNSLLPPLTYNSCAGQAIRSVLRRGRHWGLSMICGTQSPRDVDTKNFNQFNSFFVGKLGNDYDIRAALSATQMNDDRRKKVIEYVKGAKAPRMYYVMPGGMFEAVDVRWLGTLHSAIPRDRIPSLYELGHLHRLPQTEESETQALARVGRRWTHGTDGIRDEVGRLLIGVAWDATNSPRANRPLAIAPLGSRSNPIVADPSQRDGAIRLALALGQWAGAAGVRLVAWDVVSVQRSVYDATAAHSVVLPGNEQPWYDLAETMPIFAQAVQKPAPSGIAQALRLADPESDRPEPSAVSQVQALGCIAGALVHAGWGLSPTIVSRKDEEEDFGTASSDGSEEPAHAGAEAAA